MKTHERYPGLARLFDSMAPAGDGVLTAFDGSRELRLFQPLPMGGWTLTLTLTRSIVRIHVYGQQSPRAAFEALCDELSMTLEELHALEGST